MKLYDLQTLHMDHPAIDQVPCFSWKISSNRQNVMQERYRITVSQKEYYGIQARYTLQSNLLLNIMEAVFLQKKTIAGQ